MRALQTKYGRGLIDDMIFVDEIGKTESNIRNALEKNEARSQLDDPQWKSRK